MTTFLMMITQHITAVCSRDSVQKETRANLLSKDDDEQATDVTKTGFNIIYRKLSIK